MLSAYLTEQQSAHVCEESFNDTVERVLSVQIDSWVRSSSAESFVVQTSATKYKVCVLSYFVAAVADLVH